MNMYVSLLIIAKLITGAFIQLKMIVPDMSVMYTLCGNDICSLMFNNENDLVYVRLNYAAGRGLCIACNTLRMLVYMIFILRVVCFSIPEPWQGSKKHRVG